VGLKLLQTIAVTPGHRVGRYLEQLANLARLPQLKKQVAEIEERLREMESGVFDGGSVRGQD